MFWSDMSFNEQLSSLQYCVGTAGKPVNLATHLDSLDSQFPAKKRPLRRLLYHSSPHRTILLESDCEIQLENVEVENISRVQKTFRESSTLTAVTNENSRLLDQRKLYHLPLGLGRVKMFHAKMIFDDWVGS